MFKYFSNNMFLGDIIAKYKMITTTFPIPSNCSTIDRVMADGSNVDLVRKEGYEGDVYYGTPNNELGEVVDSFEEMRVEGQD